MYTHGKQIEKPALMITKEIACCFTGQKIKFKGEFIKKCDFERENVKIKSVMKNTNILFGMDWMEQFKLWNSSIISFCKEIKSFTNGTQSVKKELKIKFSEVFPRGLGRCNKMEVKFKLKEDVQPVFKNSRHVFFKASLKQIMTSLTYF